MLLTVSRSNILGLSFSFLGFLLLTVHKKYIRYLILGVLGTLLLTSGLVVFWEQIAGIASAILGRFTDTEGGGRTDMFAEAVAGISTKPIFGFGLGAKVPHYAGREVYIHNFFLNIWYMCGISGVLFAVLLYLYILLQYVYKMAVYSLGKMKKNVYFSMPWALMLPSLPLIRILVSGGAGDFALTEWIMLSMYFATIYVYFTYGESNLNGEDELQKE